MLAIIDYGAGNLRSVLHALTYLGAADTQLVRSPRELADADKVILPGVGAFGAGMAKLHEQQLVDPLRNVVRAGMPFLGICLGMQFLFETSDEMGEHKGLGLLPGRVTRFLDLPGRKVPHMGWNQLRLVGSSRLLRGLPDESFAYFVHSYHCVPEDPADVTAVVDYGIPFAAVVEHDNICGVQFHPEKSQRTGLLILKNFLEQAA
jgi:glutamine amidotransferase